ncbi:unnamed protein product [Phytomonas sp. EM1]|nr:unnamed protein product [Phytomonas sp. EM1]|eukprot:CCW62023.1 unnamed protein product [Phytomonas sp. isolate EM1]
MCDVDVNHSHAVFKIFSVEPDIKDRECEKEPCVPFFLLPVAVREMGYYPIRSQIESFLERIPSPSKNGVNFSQFLQLCEELVGTRDMCMAAVHQFVYQLENIKPSGVFTTQELLKILNLSAYSMTRDEIEAVVDLLDPMKTDRISLKSLAIVLLRHQRPLSEMSCRDIISGSTNAQLSKGKRSAILSAKLPKDSLDCTHDNAFQPSRFSKHKASYLPITPSSHQREISHKDGQESQGSRSLQHSDFNPRIASHVDLKASPASRRHFTRSPTDMSVTVDSSVGSERLKKCPDISLCDRNNNIPKLDPLGETTANTFDSLNKDRMQNSSTRRICDLSGATSSMGAPSISKYKNYESQVRKQKNGRAGCCAVC